MSIRTSGVKNFESQTTSLLRGLPFSNVQSAYANGSVGFGFSVKTERTCAAASTLAVVGVGAGVISDPVAGAELAPAAGVGVAGAVTARVLRTAFTSLL